MKIIRLRNIEEKDGVEFYLLESRELKESEMPIIVKKYLEEGEIVKIIDEYGIKGSANQFIVIKRNHNNMTSEILHFEDDSEFLY
ncbi:hypothetical protein D3C87_1078460 [compost metagenome]